MGTIAMLHNLFIAYDLIPPGQNYDAVHNQIKQLGPWYKLQYSLFYVQSAMDMKTAHDFVRLAMDGGDNLAVVDARDAFVSTLPAGDLAAIRSVFALGPVYIPA
jgi:hypothetical protein